MEPMTLEALRSLLLGVGLIGLFVSGAAYLATKLNEGIAKKLVMLTQRIGFTAGILLLLMLLAGFCGYRVTPGRLLASLKDGLRSTYGQVVRQRLGDMSK